MKGGEVVMQVRGEIVVTRRAQQQTRMVGGRKSGRVANLLCGEDAPKFKAEDADEREQVEMGIYLA